MKKREYKIKYVYLDKQFANIDRFFKIVREVVGKGDFTLGKKLQEFETNFAEKLGVKHAIGVASGTDALYLPLKALGIKAGDEVITVPNSFVATAAVIALAGATPVFVDVRDDYNIDPNLIEKAVTSRTKAIIPVHLTGFPADMYPIVKLAKKYKLLVIEDVAQAAFAKYDHKYLGTFGLVGSFSFHPLKILNIWGDGGMITTNNDNLAKKLRLWRNHGLKNRDEVEFFAHNSRLDTFHAAVANQVLSTLDWVIAKRRQHASIYDDQLRKLEPWVHIPSRNLGKASAEPVFTTYVIQVKKREELTKYLNKKGIETKIHYPTPIHLQKAADYLGYKKGDFPVCERQADTILTLPDHQYLKDKDILYVCRSIEEFYSRNK